MPAYEAATVRVRCWRDGRPTTAGLGLLVGAGLVVTCAHVVNTALGRRQDEQVPPGRSDVVQVDLPLLPGSPVRDARVVCWQPPGSWEAGAGDVAGLILTEDAPEDAVPARFMTAIPAPGTWLRVFGYPGDPPRPDGAFVDVDLKGQVGRQMLQVESRRDQTVKAQPGFSGSPVWNTATGQAAGLLHAAPRAGEPQRDAYLLPPEAIAAAWEEPFDYLLVPENPYRGLEPFTEEQAGLFFGRDDDTAALTERVRIQPVTVVVGSSGVGKSSLVRAGLIPALGDSWSVALVRPGQDPWLRLAGSLLRTQHGPDVRVTEAECRREITRLRTDGLRPVAEFLRSQDRRLLVVVDQFEEVLATGAGPDPALLDLLLPQPEMAVQAARVVVTLRVDYQPTLQSIPGLHPRLNDRLYLLSPLTRPQIADAVQRPAAARDVDFEPGLADHIISDAIGGALPVLEFTLTRLWQAQRRKTLTFAGYHAMGGVRGALDRFADQQAARLGESVTGLLDRVLLRLVRVPTGAPELTTRQRVWQSQMPATEWQMLQRLATARLVVQDVNPADGEPYAELAHETLITAWRRLSELVAANSEFLVWLAWIQQRAKDNDPLPEERIPEARRWAAQRPADIPPAVAMFIRSSETAIEERLRELREARDQAEAARERADAAARRAEARRLAAAAELALASTINQKNLAIALAVESLRLAPTIEGDIAARNAIRAIPLRRGHLDSDSQILATAYSMDGTRVATGNLDGFAQVFSSDTGDEISRVEHRGDVNTVAFSPSGTQVATGSSDGTARVFDASSGRERWYLRHGGPVQAVAFSPEGMRLATGSTDRTARVVTAATGAEICLIKHRGHVNAVAFSPDGRQIATGSNESSARVVNANTGKVICRLRHCGAVWAVAFSPNGTCVATGSRDGTARVFDATTGTEICRLEHGAPVLSVAFSPNGSQVATGSDDRSSRVLDATTGSEVCRLDHDDSVWAVAFSPDGTRVATGSHDCTARVFDASTGTEICRLYHNDSVLTVAFSPDGTQVAAGGNNRDPRTWVVDRDEFFRLAEHGVPRNLTLPEWRRYFGDEPYRRTRADLDLPDETPD
jgi:WD40 repeat protein